MPTVVPYTRIEHYITIVTMVSLNFTFGSELRKNLAVKVGCSVQVFVVVECSMLSHEK